MTVAKGKQVSGPTRNIPQQSISDLAYELWSVHPSTIDKWADTAPPIPLDYPGGWRAWYYANRIQEFISQTPTKRDTLTDVMASLAGAISLLEIAPQASAAAPSDTMFNMMLADYRASLERARKAPAPNARGDIALIREALSDPTIASYPDFTSAVEAALGELERFRSERSYIVGFNDGWEGAQADERWDCCKVQRQPPAYGDYPDAALQLKPMLYEAGYFIEFNHNEMPETGITAEQAREAAHLLNQLAEYLECK